VKAQRFTQLNVWPVLQRELREGARRRVNHRLRFLSAGVGTLVLWIIAANAQKSAAQLGGWLFCGLHTLLLGLIFLIVPALTADCIAREKREGTLGLLFLTPLSAGGIVAGKALAQALRALTLWVAVLPILAIPFMTGGITWFDACIALSLEFCTTVLCLAAGLLASSLARERNTAFLLAFLFATTFLLLFSQLFAFILIGTWRGFASANPNGMPWWRWQLATMPLFSGLLDVRGFAGWSSIASFSGVLSRIWVCLCGASLPVVLLIFYVAARFAARRIQRSWQDKIPSPRRESLLRLYCAPLSGRRFRRKMQRTLDWNPIAWLQQYSWKARLSKWGLCLVFLMIEWAALQAPDGTVSLIRVPLLLALAGIYTFVGVNSFLEEKRSGALELILVTPITVNKLIFGRTWGLWKQFIPAGLILAGDYLLGGGLYKVWLWRPSMVLDFFSEALQSPFILACAFLTLPVFATYFALRVKNLIVAGVLTWIALCLPAAFATEFIQMFTNSDQLEMWLIPPMALLSYGAFTLLTCFLLRHSLSRRIYSF
jgi:ABC-type Na+ efflux pump permease subunit